MVERIAPLAALALLLSGAPLAAQSQPDERMSFFLTSVGPGHGADLGGLEGADAHCEHLAYAVGADGKTWRAYLSATGLGGGATVDARDRIGSGPWHNFRGVEVAADVDALHGDNDLTRETVLTEWGQVVRGRGDSPNRHDVLTGSTLAGRAFERTEDNTCSDWTSSGSDGSARVGHFDRTGGGEHPSSWNSAHGSRGCGQDDLRATGGDGLFYCFALDD